MRHDRNRAFQGAQDVRDYTASTPGSGTGGEKEGLLATALASGTPSDSMLF
jgi:hypothetical protein